MNIGEIRHGVVIVPNDSSGRVETRLDWLAERTSSTTTVITTMINFRLLGANFGNGYLYSGATVTVNGTNYYSSTGATGFIYEFDNSKAHSLPRVTHTITHGSSGIESFTLGFSGYVEHRVSGSTQVKYNSNLTQTTINLNSGKLAKVLTTQTDQAYEGYKRIVKLLYNFEQSIENNSSDVEAYLYYSSDYTGASSTNKSIKMTTSISINGVSTSLLTFYSDYGNWSGGRVYPNSTSPSGTNTRAGADTYVGSATGKVYHNSDGTKTFKIAGTIGSFTAKEDVVLPEIPRAATLLTAPNFTDEDNPTITYSNPAGSVVTTLQAAISLDGTSAAIGWKSLSKTGTSYTFNLTDDERNTLRSAASDAATIQVYFLLQSVIGGNTYTEKAERTLSIVSCNPVLNSTVIDTNATTVALTGDSTKLVKFYSNAQASLNVTLVKGATLAYYEIKNGANYGNTQVYTFNNVENNKFEFLARDSRGNIATKTVTPTMVEYIKLTCNLGSNLPDTSGNYDISVTGNYFNGSFGAVNNTLTVQYRYKTENGSYSSWTTMSVSSSNGTYTATARVTGLDYRAAYVVQVRATDKITTITSDERKVQTTPQFSWSKDDFEFNTDVRIKGDLRLKGDGNYGNTLYFGDGSYSYIKEETDDDLTIKSSDITLQATNLYLNGSGQVKINGSILPSIETGTWDAVLGSSAAVKSYTSRQGWYIKIGNVVTIGWNVDVTCNSGYQSTAIKIAGAPYYPSVSAAGGGILYGAYTTGGLAFEGWVIEESGGAITPRLQPCNNTSAANLNISSTAYYPNGGGNLKCFGSITYITDN